jgi:hypothetical protein
MPKKWIFLTCVLSLGSIETLQAHPLDSRDIVYIDGVPCNSACQSYMAWSRQMLSASGHQAPTQLRQRSASAIAHRATTPARQVRVARQAVPLPPARVALLQPADHAAGKPERGAQHACTTRGRLGLKEMNCHACPQGRRDMSSAVGSVKKAGYALVQQAEIRRRAVA